MSSRRSLIAAGTLAALLAVAAAVASYVWWYRPRAEDGRAFSAVQFLQLALVTWNVLHSQGASGLPTPYPARLEDLAEHGLVDGPTLASHQRETVIEYLPPPGDLDEDARMNWIILKASTPRGTWIGTLGGDPRWEENP
jgi:hypothetical protein